MISWDNQKERLRQELDAVFFQMETSCSRSEGTDTPEFRKLANESIDRFVDKLLKLKWGPEEHA